MANVSKISDGTTTYDISSVTVKNQNSLGNSLKMWTGTKAQYDAIATKDNNTLYNITDDTQASTYEAYSKSETYNRSEIDSLVANNLSTLLSNLYPVGSIYIGMQSTCPLATLISGSTWVKVSEGRVLQGSDNNHNAGTTIEAGLPNITGDFSIRCVYDNNNPISDHSGAFYSNGNGTTNTYQVSYNNNSKQYFKKTSFSASRSSSIYGNSTTVQPLAYVVNIWRRTA